MLKQIGATYGEQVMVDFELSETDPHPTPYATRSAYDNLAIRLSFLVIALLHIAMCSLHSVLTS